MSPVQFTYARKLTKTANKLSEKLKKLSILQPTTLPSTVIQEKCTSQKSSTTFLGVDRSSNESDQMVDSDLPQHHMHLTIPSNRFSRAVSLALLWSQRSSSDWDDKFLLI